MSKSEIEIQKWLQDAIHDEKHFTARWAKKYSKITGIEVELLSKGVVLLLVVVLLVVKKPYLVANGLLVAVPAVCTYLEGPSQRPDNGVLFVYWSLFGAFALVDRSLEAIPGYYIVKLVVFVALFLPPTDPVIGKMRKKIEQLRK